jgi:hypothetical protein
VNAIPSRYLSPIDKLVFYALATKACGTDRTVWMSDGAIARRCGVSRPSVISGLHQLLVLGLVEKVGPPVNQVQAYRICPPMFRAAYGQTLRPRRRPRVARRRPCVHAQIVTGLARVSHGPAFAGVARRIPTCQLG